MADQKISALTAATTPLAGTEVLPIVQSGATVKVSVDNLTTGKNVKAASVSVGTTSTVGKVTVNGDVQAQGAFGTLSGSLGVAIGATSGAISGNDMCVVAADAYNNYNDLWLIPRNNGANVGNVILKSGNFVVGVAAKGVNFTANTPAAGMTSQLLNWYEEGTWTPVLRFGGGSNSTYSVQIGNYTRIGRQVTLTCTITLTAKGASTGVATVTGFPFTTLTSVPTVTLWQGDSVTFTGSYPLVYAAGGATDCGLFGADNAGTYTQLTHSNFSNTSTLRFSITYNV